jgi:uncharacterized membrane protein
VPRANSAEASGSGELASFDTWRAVVKTFTYRVMVTTADFGANYFVTGELATAAGLSSVSLAAGPIAYFAHEAAWHFYGPASARNGNPLKAAVHLPLPGAIEESGRAVLVPRNIYEEAREVARACGKTEAYARSRRDRKKVEMLFAHLKRILRLDRLRLRDPSGARFEFTLAAIKLEAARQDSQPTAKHLLESDIDVRVIRTRAALGARRRRRHVQRRGSGAPSPCKHD